MSKHENDVQENSKDIAINVEDYDKKIAELTDRIKALKKVKRRSKKIIELEEKEQEIVRKMKKHHKSR